MKAISISSHKTLVLLDFKFYNKNYLFTKKVLKVGTVLRDLIYQVIKLISIYKYILCQIFYLYQYNIHIYIYTNKHYFLLRQLFRYFAKQNRSSVSLLQYYYCMWSLSYHQRTSQNNQKKVYMHLYISKLKYILL